MIITIVTDQFYQKGNGTCISAQNLYNELVKLGHTVRVLTVDNGENTEYALPERNFGIINRVIHSQGMQLAQPNERIITKTIMGADVLHIYTPFKLGQKTAELCKRYNIPCSAGFHIVPENITSTIYLKKCSPINKWLWSKWKNTLYKYVSHIHCPSTMVANLLQKHNFNAKLHIISNGYKPAYTMQRQEKPLIFKDKIVIVATGRFSHEKRYDVLVRAISKSVNKNKIQLIIGGKGPQMKYLKKLGEKLPNVPIFIGKYDMEQQITFLNYADLYIHTADIEVEGLTCLEAIACGCVPIVADSYKSATPQFATHPNSIYKDGNSVDLAKKIDWWIEHYDILQSQRTVVAQHAKLFALSNSVDKYIEMFVSAIIQHKIDGKANIYQLEETQICEQSANG